MRGDTTTAGSIVAGGSAGWRIRFLDGDSRCLFSPTVFILGGLGSIGSIGGRGIVVIVGRGRLYTRKGGLCGLVWMLVVAGG